MTRKTFTAVVIATVLGGWSLVGCKEQGPMEEAGEKVDEAVEEAGEAVEEAGEKIEDAGDDIDSAPNP